MRPTLGATLLAASLLLASCGATTSAIGPLEITPPEGWLVTDRTASSLKVTNGTLGGEEDAQAGTATAVFDVYVNSSQSLGSFLEILKAEKVEPSRELIEIDGHQATVVSYRSNHFGPSTEIVFVPEWDVRFVYRAAFSEDEGAFVRNREAFREALDSVRFNGRPERA